MNKQNTIKNIQLIQKEFIDSKQVMLEPIKDCYIEEFENFNVRKIEVGNCFLEFAFGIFGELSYIQLFVKEKQFIIKFDCIRITRDLFSYLENCISIIKNI